MSDQPANAGPVGWRIMIQDHQPAKVTEGGIHLTDESKDHARYLNYVGKVVEMGPACYQHPKFLKGEPWCKVGDWIVFGRYAGQNIQFKGSETVYRFVNDDEVLAVISDPNQILVYVT
jgi:co-chaperonin GroES (HSP10)